jgi:hypothetical protein
MYIIFICSCDELYEEICDEQPYDQKRFNIYITSIEILQTCMNRKNKKKKKEKY